jgi:malate dehydrogenase (oxaloacetate-decarboxylating)
MSNKDQEIDLDNISILRNPSINKGTAFTIEERIDFGLVGLLPHVVNTIDDQMGRVLDNFNEQGNQFSKVLVLKELRERNEVLYFKMLATYPEKLLPYVYTPMVGEVAMKFHANFTHPRGIYFAYPEKALVGKIVDSIPSDEIQVIVITDGSRILGLGDMGAGGMAIPIGKLDLYTVFGGIHPEKVLPICIDVGTNNQKLIDDPHYIGWKHARIQGKEYDDFVESIIKALKNRFPSVLLQWEDFAKEHARSLLDRYVDKICSFNDDIQGTAASALVAITAGMKINHSKIQDQKIAILGGGSAGTGIADLILHALTIQGVKEEEAKKNIYIIDIQGLLVSNQPHLDPAQKVFAHSPQEVTDWDLDKDGKIGLLDVIKKKKITVLIGVSGQPNTFTEEMILQMAKNCPHPIIMPLSNPTAKAEAIPADILRWTKGKALIATGSPFDPVDYEGKTYFISQCNNVYIFPGLGLGLIAAHAKKVSIEMFIKACEVVSEEALKYQDGRLFPKISDLREVSKKIGQEIFRLAIKLGLNQRGNLQTVNELIESVIWTPQYKKFKKKK